LGTTKSPLERDQSCAVAAEPMSFVVCEKFLKLYLQQHRHSEETGRVTAEVPVICFELLLKEAIKH
jgi:hypothetical protein